MTVTLTVSNTTPRPITIAGSGSCTFDVVVRDSAGRVPEPYRSRACTMDLRRFTFAPGERRTSRHVVGSAGWSNALQRQVPLAPGRYELAGVVAGSLEREPGRLEAFHAESGPVPLAVVGFSSLPWANAVLLDVAEGTVTRGTDGGAALHFTVRNAGRDPILISQCGERPIAEVDRLVVGGWQNAATAFCAANLSAAPLRLLPGATATGQATVRESGMFRLRLRASLDVAGGTGSGTWILSDLVTVR